MALECRVAGMEVDKCGLTKTDAIRLARVVVQEVPENPERLVLCEQPRLERVLELESKRLDLGPQAEPSSVEVVVQEVETVLSGQPGAPDGEGVPSRRFQLAGPGVGLVI